MENPVKPLWKLSPRAVYSPGLRTFMAVLGALVPITCTAVGSGIVRSFENGTQTVGLTFYLVLFVIFATVIAGTVHTVRSEFMDAYHYFLFGSVWPSGTYFLFYVTQALLK
jgi:hypothetical protein